MESCPTQAVLPLVGLAADNVIRDRHISPSGQTDSMPVSQEITKTSWPVALLINLANTKTLIRFFRSRTNNSAPTATAICTCKFS
ncbi:MAG: hypothetical protein R6U98_09815 [Pirellulaceae bacterium]